MAAAAVGVCHFYVPCADEPRLCLLCGYFSFEHRKIGDFWVVPRNPTIMERNSQHRHSLSCDRTPTLYDVRAEFIPKGRVKALTAQYNHRRPLESFLAADDEENGRISPESDQNFITVNGGEEVDTCSASDADFFQNVGQLNHSPTSPFEKYPQSMPKSASTSVLFDSVRISAASSTPPPKPPYRTKHGHKGPPPPPPPRIDSLLRQLPVVPNPRHNGHNGHNGHAKANAVTFQTEHTCISEDGGQEYFFVCDNDVLDDNDASESIPSEDEFDPETKSNTVFNGDRQNFIKAQQQNADNAANNNNAEPGVKRFASLEDLSSISTSSASGNKQDEAQPCGTLTARKSKSNDEEAEKSMQQNGTALTPIVEQVDKDEEKANTPGLLSCSADLIIDPAPCLPYSYSTGSRSSSSDDTLSLCNHSNDTLTLAGLSQFSTSVEVEENSIDQPTRKLSLTSEETDESTYDNVPRRAASSYEVLGEILYQQHQQPPQQQRHLLPFIELHELKQYSGKKTGKFNPALDAKLRRFARELEELRTCSDPEYAKRRSNGKVPPARPPPPKMKVNQMTPRTQDMLPDQRFVHNAGNLRLGQIGICQHRTRRIIDNPQAPPPPAIPEPLSIRNKGKFASIRKFFKLDNRDASVPRFGSVRRQLPFSRPKLDISTGKYASVRGGSQERPCSLMFHSMHEDCFLDDEIAGLHEDGDIGNVKITEFAEISTGLCKLQKPAKPLSELRLDALAATPRSCASAVDLRETNVDGDLATPTPTADEESTGLLETSFPASPPPSSDMQSSEISIVSSPPNGSFKERRKSESSVRSQPEPVPVPPVRKQHPTPPAPPPRPPSNEDPKPPQSPTKPPPYLYSFANDFIGPETRKLSKSVEKLKLTAEERYENMTSMHLNTLAEIAENFPNLANIWRAQQGKEIAFSGAKWSHFTVVGNTPLLVTNCATFYPAVYRENGSQDAHPVKVNLLISTLKHCHPPATTKPQPAPFMMPILGEFQEAIPSKFLRLTYFEDDSGSESTPDEDRVGNCRIVILPRMLLATVDTYSDQTASKHGVMKQPKAHEREVCFVLMQMIAALKHLQSQGIEEVSMDLEGFLLMRTTTSRMPQLVLQWESFFTDANSSTGNPDPIPAPNISLCQAALVALSLLLHVEIPASEIVSNRECVPKFARLSPYSEALQKVGEILAAERAHSLTQAKALLEYTYWVRGSDILELEDPDSNQELEEDVIRQWLEAERAALVQHFIKSLLREKQNLDVLEQYHVLFLLQTSLKQIIDAHQRLKQYSSEVIL